MDFDFYIGIDSVQVLVKGKGSEYGVIVTNNKNGWKNSSYEICTTHDFQHADFIRRSIQFNMKMNKDYH